MTPSAVTDSVSPGYRAVRGLCRVLLRAYYPDLVVEGAERVPAGPLLACANHPNSLIDPVLVSVFLPRKIHWLAKHTLFGNPLVGRALLALGAIPVKRRHEGGDRSSTDETLRAAADALVEGRAIGIFPEGKSHDDERLAPLKTGAGRMATLAARTAAASGARATIRVLPVVLRFTSKTRFRTGAMLSVGEPIGVGPHDSPELVMEMLQRGMTSLMAHVETEAQEALLKDVRVLLRRRAALDPAHSDPAELHRLDKEIARAIRRFSAEEPERVEAFRERLHAYVEALDRQGLSLHSLEEVREPGRRTWIALALLPIAAWGALHSALPYWITRRVGLLQARATDRTTIALFALLTGAVVFPAFWIAESLLVGAAVGAPAAVLFLLTAPATGLVARWVLHVLRRRLARLGDALLMGAHPRAVERLKAERAWLWSEIDRWQGMLSP